MTRVHGSQCTVNEDFPRTSENLLNYSSLKQDDNIYKIITNQYNCVLYKVVTERII